MSSPTRHRRKDRHFIRVGHWVGHIDISPINGAAKRPLLLGQLLKSRVRLAQKTDQLSHRIDVIWQRNILCWNARLCSKPREISDFHNDLQVFAMHPI